MSDDEKRLDDEEMAALALIPFAKEVADMIRARVPQGTDFGVFFFADGEPEGRVVAITSDRDRVAVYVGQWLLNILGSPEDRAAMARRIDEGRG